MMIPLKRFTVSSFRLAQVIEIKGLEVLSRVPPNVLEGLQSSPGAGSHTNG